MVECSRPRKAEDNQQRCNVRIKLRREGGSGDISSATALTVHMDCQDSKCAFAAQHGVQLNSTSKVTWSNESHGFIDTNIIVAYGTGAQQDSNFSFVVGYHPQLYPDSLLQGTLATPDSVWPVYPWCLEAGECREHADGKVQVSVRGHPIMCDEGQHAVDGHCASCPAGFTAPRNSTSCTECGRWRLLDGKHEWCIMHWVFISLVFGGWSALACGFAVLCLHLDMVVRGWRLCLVGRPLQIRDVYSEHGKTILQTVFGHGLRMWGARSFTITFHGTKHPLLDASDVHFRARVVGPDRLELLDGQHEAVERRLDTSMGVARLSPARSLWHAACPLPAACMGTFVSLVGGAMLSTLQMAGQSKIFLEFLSRGVFEVDQVDYDFTDVIVAVVAAALLFAIVATSLSRFRSHNKAPLPAQIKIYRRVLRESNLKPQSCNKGPGRAIQAGQLLDFLSHFQTFVRDRSMYYIVSNILEPLTAPEKLSFAELAGPGMLDWFVSHYWGHAFGDFCSSIQKHAQVAPGPDGWRHQRYWICSFSNNQHKVKEELGSTWSQSSFYLALMSPQRRGSCLVVDEAALPLTRSWCLFEVAQTVELEESLQADHHGLVFCTSSGVVNEGHSSAEVALGLARRLSTLRLQDADASDPNDHAMIKDFVVREMGGFDKMNAEIRTRIACALRNAKGVVLNSFESLEAELDSTDPREVSIRVSL